MRHKRSRRDGAVASIWEEDRRTKRERAVSNESPSLDRLGVRTPLKKRPWCQPSMALRPGLFIICFTL
jgi:hypothetical protein